LCPSPCRGADSSASRKHGKAHSESAFGLGMAHGESGVVYQRDNSVRQFLLYLALVSPAVKGRGLSPSVVLTHTLKQ
jgi:hypothetical protein